MHADEFAENGFLKVAEAAQQLSWTQIGLAQDHPESRTKPLVWAADLSGEGPFGVLPAGIGLAPLGYYPGGAGTIGGAAGSTGTGGGATYPGGGGPLSG